ncbi:uncharacterized protein LOC132798012 [Drosophila nasuta]|uniref:uncharacterized protein LOC132798012 n=1 Tax=Drosophila nasuta TaxID=42062 RepID=UPI00295F10EB|nr:uncharacterized protein LOC132798012 [Drosophila nasuta]
MVRAQVSAGQNVCDFAINATGDGKINGRRALPTVVRIMGGTTGGQDIVPAACMDSLVQCPSLWHARGFPHHECLAFQSPHRRKRAAVSPDFNSIGAHWIESSFIGCSAECLMPQRIMRAAPPLRCVFGLTAK